MNIVIVGTGAVGEAICSGLAKEGHSITIIDKDRATIEELSAEYDLSGHVGNGADIDVLRAVGAERADLLIAVTQSDELNMLCCFAAKKLGTKHTIARVRNPEYAALVELTAQDMGLSFLINPDYLAAREIYRVLRLPAATKVESFCHGKVETVEFTVQEGSPIIGKSLHELKGEIEVKFLISGIKRGDKTFIPLGSTVIEDGDILALTAADDETAKFFKAIKSYKRPVKNVLITGAGRTTYYISEMMKRTKTNVTVVERDRELCHAIAEGTAFNVVNMDANKQQNLLACGIDKVDAFLALSDIDEENAINSIFAKNIGVPKIITMIRSMSYINLFREIGLTGIVSPKYASVEEILRFVRSTADTGASEIKSLHKLMDGDIEALEFSVLEPISRLTEIPLSELSRKDNTLIASIVRGKEIIIPQGSDMILPGDSVIVVTMEQSMDSIKDILR